MKKNRCHRLIVLFFCLISFNAIAKDLILIGLSKDQNEFLSFKSQCEKKEHSVFMLPTQTTMFENMNTHVQLYPLDQNQKDSVVYRDVHVVLTPTLDYNSLMEALIKIRAAKTFGAKSIEVVSNVLLKDIVIEDEFAKEIDLEEFISVAGADFISEKGVKREIKKFNAKKNEVTQEDYWIAGANYIQLLAQTSQHLGKKYYSFDSIYSMNNELKGRMIYFVAATELPINKNFFQTLAQIKFLTQKGAHIHLISPYLPYARSDKPEYEVGVTSQGRLAADLIEAVGTQGITVVRAHAPQSLGFFKIHSHEISGRSTIVEYLKSQNVDCVVSPDAGFQKDATKYRDELAQVYGNKPVGLLVMNKQRDSNGKEKIIDAPELKAFRDKMIQGKNVVVIDDETCTGGTSARVAEILSESHPKTIFAVVTHLAGSAKSALESKSIEKLVVTDTVPITISHPKLEVLSISKEIANRIQIMESNR